MKLTKRQRRDVVELLRCAADEAQIGSDNGLFSVAIQLGHGVWMDALPLEPKRLVWDVACGARNYVSAMDGFGRVYWHECLEAAQLVEEHQWP